MAGPYSLQGDGYTLVLDRVTFFQKDQVHNLEVLLYLGLLLDKVAAMASSAVYQLGLGHQLWPYLTQKNLAIVTHALVASRLY